MGTKIYICLLLGHHIEYEAAPKLDAEREKKPASWHIVCDRIHARGISLDESRAPPPSPLSLLQISQHNVSISQLAFALKPIYKGKESGRRQLEETNSPPLHFSLLPSLEFDLPTDAKPKG